MTDQENTTEEPKETTPAPETAPTTTEPVTTSKAGNKNVLIIVLVVVVAIIGFAGYSYATKKFIFTKSGTIDGVKYKTDGKETTMSDENGKITVGDDVKLPKDFPSDIPVHPKGKIGVVSSESADATWISMDIKDSLTNVKAWYKTESVKKGWKIWAEDENMLTLTNEKYGASVSFTEDNGNILTNFSTMKLDAVKSLTGVDPNTTTATELEKKVLDGTYQAPVFNNADELTPEEVPTD